MGAFSRAEISDAFEHYLTVGRACGESGDWTAWADLFTEDAHYWEHHYGHMEGREQIRYWITSTMSTFPGTEMPWFVPEWHVIDEDSGRVVVYIQNRMRDPGDGSVHEAPNITILRYAGDGLWSYEEDVYNTAQFATMILGWMERARQLGTLPDDVAFEIPEPG